MPSTSTTYQSVNVPITDNYQTTVTATAEYDTISTLSSITELLPSSTDFTSDDLDQKITTPKYGFNKDSTVFMEESLSNPLLTTQNPVEVNTDDKLNVPMPSTTYETTNFQDETTDSIELSLTTIAKDDGTTNINSNSFDQSTTTETNIETEIPESTIKGDFTSTEKTMETTTELTTASQAMETNALFVNKPNTTTIMPNNDLSTEDLETITSGENVSTSKNELEIPTTTTPFSTENVSTKTTKVTTPISKTMPPRSQSLIPFWMRISPNIGWNSKLNPCGITKHEWNSLDRQQPELIPPSIASQMQNLWMRMFRLNRYRCEISHERQHIQHSLIQALDQYREKISREILTLSETLRQQERWYLPNFSQQTKTQEELIRLNRLLELTSNYVKILNRFNHYEWLRN